MSLIPKYEILATDSETVRGLKMAANTKFASLPAEFDYQRLSQKADFFSALALRIRPKETEGGTAPFVFNDIQMDHLVKLRQKYRVLPGVDAFRGIRDIILKPRQLGFTTYIAALFFMDGLLHPGRNCLVLTHLNKISQQILKIYKGFFDGLPAEIKANLRLKHASALHLSIEFLDKDGKVDLVKRPSSEFMIHTAEGFDMRGLTAQNVHFCLGPETKVIGKDGYPYSIINPPDRIRDGNGALIDVKNISKTYHKGETALSIKSYGNSAFPIIATKDHQILTREHKTGKAVWKRADEITQKDYVAFPITQIGCFKSKILKIVHRKNCIHIPDFVNVDIKFGELIGWYLAEGCTFKNGDQIGGIGLAIDKDEVEQVLEVVNPYVNGGYFTSMRIDPREESRTVTISLYGGSFSDLIIGLVGETSSKHIPDAFFKYPIEFQKGLISGLLEGDGCFTNIKQVAFTSIRPQLSIQLKRLCINLRIGLPAIYVVPAGIRNGRNEKEQWQVRFFGPANVKLRRLLNKPLPARCNSLQAYIDRHPGTKKEKENYGRHNWRRGRNYYWAKVTEVLEIECPEYMYDLILDKDPHSFTTLGGVVHNSEAAFYSNWPELVKGILQAVPATGNVFLESTANGFNHYKDLVDAAQLGRGYNLTFYPWYKHKEYCIPVTLMERREIENNMDDEEKELFENQKVTIEQLNWRRKKLEGMDGLLNSLHQEYPATISESFISSGRPRFDPSVVSKNLEITKQIKPKGSLDAGIDIYFEPEPDDFYILCADPSEGIDRGDGDHAAEQGGTDYSAGSVISATTLRTMATIHGLWEPAEFARLLAKLGVYYDAMIAVERNNHGHTVLYALEESNYPRIYRHLEYDVSGKSYLKMGFPTTPQTKTVMVDTLAEIIRRNALPACEWRFWAEAMVFVRDPGGKCAAMPGRHDDRVMSKAIGVYVATLGAKAWGGAGMVDGADGANLPLGNLKKGQAALFDRNPDAAIPQNAITEAEMVQERPKKETPVNAYPQKQEGIRGNSMSVQSPLEAIGHQMIGPGARTIEDHMVFGRLQAARAELASLPTCGNCVHCRVLPSGIVQCATQHFQIKTTDPSCFAWENPDQVDNKQDWDSKIGGAENDQ